MVAVLAGLWLVGTCAAAPRPCDVPCANGGDASHAMTMPCEQAMAACDLSALNVPAVSTFDFSVTPVVLTALRFELIATTAPRAPPLSWQAIRPPPTPLYLTYLALLN